MSTNTDLINQFNGLILALNTIIFGDETQDVELNGIIKPVISKVLKEATDAMRVAGGLVGFSTLAELNAYTPAYPKQLAEVYGTGTQYAWNGSAWVPTGSGKLTIAAAEANLMYKPQVISVATDFNTFKTYGVRSFVSGTVWNASANKPKYDNQWGHVIVLPISTVVVAQLVICMNANTLCLRFSNTDGSWLPWKYFDNSDNVALAITTDIKTNIKSYTSLTRLSQSRNRYDKTSNVVGYEVLSGGALGVQADSVITGRIFVGDATCMYISGLQVNTQIGRYYVFYDKSGTVVGSGYLGGASISTTEFKLPVPINAEWLIFTVKQRNPAALDDATIQIESGIAKTTYEAFKSGGASSILGEPLVERKRRRYGSSSKNLFNKDTLLYGREIYGDGTLGSEVNSITSDYIDVRGLSSITISGLLANPEIARYYRFLTKNDSLIIKAQLPNPNTNHTLIVPANAEWFQFSVLQRTQTPYSDSNIQVEAGSNVTAFEAFSPVMTWMDGYRLSGGSQSSGGSTIGMMASRAIGAKYLIFGDSITQTSDVDNNIFTQSDWYPNWPTYAKDQLKMSVFRNYAKSGAAFREYSGQLTYQKMSNQLLKAIENGESPDVIVVACGTNDGINYLSDYDAALAKPTLEDLNRATTTESARWFFWKMKQQWPDAIIFYSTPLQRADSETSTRKPLLDMLTNMAHRHGATVIDSHNESGIVKDLEVWQGPGKFTVDGLHPNTAGKMLMSNLITSKIYARMVY